MAKFVNKNTAALALSATGLGISGANLLVNYRRGKENTELQNKQLKAITKLTNSLEKVDKSLKEQKLNERRIIKLILLSSILSDNKY